MNIKDLSNRRKMVWVRYDLERFPFKVGFLFYRWWFLFWAKQTTKKWPITPNSRQGHNMVSLQNTSFLYSAHPILLPLKNVVKDWLPCALRSPHYDLTHFMVSLFEWQQQKTQRTWCPNCVIFDVVVLFPTKTRLVA